MHEGGDAPNADVGARQPREALGESGLEAVGACAATAGRASDNIWVDIANNPYVGCYS